MGFKPGVSGNPSGRPKKLLRRVDEVLHEKKVCPVSKVLDLLETGDMTDGVRLKGWLELFSYVFPRIKEQPEDPRENLEKLSKPELIKRAKEMLRELEKEAA